MFMFQAAKCRGCGQVLCCSTHRKQHERICMSFMSKFIFHASKSPHPNLSSGVYSGECSSHLKEERDKLVDQSHNRRKRHHVQSSSPYPHSSENSSSSVGVPHNRKYKKAVRGKFRKIQKLPTLESVKEEDEEREGGGDNDPSIQDNGLCVNKLPNRDAYIEFIVGSLKDSPITLIPSVSLKNDNDSVVTPSAFSVIYNDNEKFKTSTPDSFPILGDPPITTPLSKQGYKLPHSVMALKASTPKEKEEEVRVGVVGQVGGVELNQGIDAGLTPTAKIQPLLCTPAASQPPEQQGYFTCQSSSDQNEKGILVTPLMSSGTRNDCNEISTSPVDGEASNTQHSNQLNKLNETKHSSVGMVYDCGSVELKQGIDRGPTQSTPEIDAGLTPVTKVQPLLCTPAASQPPELQGFFTCQSSDWNEKGILVTPLMSSGTRNYCNEISTPPVDGEASNTQHSNQLNKPNETKHSSVGMVYDSGSVELKQGIDRGPTQSTPEIDAGLTPVTKVQPLLCTPAASQPPELQGFFTCQSSSNWNEKGILVTPLMSSGTRNYCNEISTPPVDGEASNTQHSNQLNKPNETKHSSVGMVYDCGSVELKQGIDRGPTQSTPEIDAGLTPVTKVQPLLCTPAASQPPELQGFFTCQSSSDQNEKGILVTPLMPSGTRNYCNEISTPPVDGEASNTQHSNQLNKPNETKNSSVGMVYDSGSVELKQGIDRRPTQSTPEIDAGLTPVTKVQPLLCTPAASQPPELQGFFTCQSSSDWNEKGILVTPVMSSETRNDCNEISTPPVDSKASKTQYSNQLNLSNDSKQSPFGMLYGSGSVELKPGIDTCAQRPKPQRFSISRSSSGSTASSVYYSSGSVISPLALNSHPCTPVTNPSLFTSIKDVFRTFISHLPGQRGDVNVDGVAPLNSQSVSSPARKRIKMADLTRIKCRPTFKRRYKKPASYVFKR